MQDKVTLMFAMAMAAILASAGTVVVMDLGQEDGENAYGYSFPTLDTGLSVPMDLYDAMSPQDGAGLRKFNGFPELRAYLKGHAAPDVSHRYDYGYNWESINDSEDGASMAMGASDSYYTGTNNQVAGVDEGDSVKTDGRHAYIISEAGDMAFIVLAHPAEDAKVECVIEASGTLLELYVLGDRLVLLEQVYYFEGGFKPSSHMYSDAPMVNVKVLDMSNRSAPVQVNYATLGGEYLTSRMVGDTLYAIGTQCLRQWDNESQLPVPLESLYSIETEQGEQSLTAFLTLDISSDEAVPSILGIAMASSTNVFVSEKSIYLTRTEYHEGVGLFGEGYSSYESTAIHRFGLQGRDIKYRASGEVPGHVLNRYSMDEHGGHFRIATTQGWWGDGTQNMVHVMDMALDVTGKLEGIAPGETIYSARFMGPRLYLVTFRQVDPFYVIDLHDAESPKILGYLKIPGYSSYLHPYDSDHIIGLGREGSLLKLALFNVTDVTAPTEIDSVTLGSRYSDSPALNDPHAFLFDPAHGVVVIPVDSWDYSYYSSHETGAVVLSISPESGIHETGWIQHDAGTGIDDYYGQQHDRVRRSFIIEDVLYTVSSGSMKASSLDGLDGLSVVRLDQDITMLA